MYIHRVIQFVGDKRGGLSHPVLRRIALTMLLILMAGCDRLSFINPTVTPSTLPTVASPTTGFTPTVEATATQSGPITLRIWLPPQFDPDAGAQAGKLLKARLDEFTQRRPEVRLDIRVKALDGPGGILETLSTASAAAPGALPDLIAIPRPILEAAALKGLLQPFDGLTNSLEDTDWYNFARELSRIQNSTYGLPFAGDAFVLVYRPSVVAQPPRDWDDVLTSPGPLVFSAADSQALCTLTFYEAAGGEVQNADGRPGLDVAVLASVLEFYQQILSADLLLPSLPQIENDNEVWAAYLGGQANLAITWSSWYIRQLSALNTGVTPTSSNTPIADETPAPGSLLPEDIAASPIPTPDGVRFSLATGWVWALASHHPERQALSVQLAEYLTQSDFLAEWTLAAGYLPPRSNALSAWTNTKAQSLAGQIAISAHLFPPIDVLSSLAPPLKQAVMDILEQKGEPLALAQDAAERVENP